ncbi:hypothetical protein T439DRAFT_324180 [Meredithblackwellia eburnea MCA 4105]
MDDIFHIIPSGEKVVNSTATNTGTADYSNAFTWESTSATPLMAYQHDPTLIPRFDAARAKGLANLSASVSATFDNPFLANILERITSTSDIPITDESEVEVLLDTFVWLASPAVKALFHHEKNARPIGQTPSQKQNQRGYKNITVLASESVSSSPRLATVAVECKVPAAFISLTGVDGLTSPEQTTVAQLGKLTGSKAIAKNFLYKSHTRRKRGRQ